MKGITFFTAARKSLKRLDEVSARRIKSGIERYAETGEGDVKALKAVSLNNERALRLRIGDYRVIFIETLEVVAIEKIGHRRDVYQ
jgi:mRNA interferase RelE/StbE